MKNILFALLLLPSVTNALTIGISGSQNQALETFLTEQGHTVSNFGLNASTITGDYVGLDFYILDSRAGSSALEQYVLNGGHLIGGFANATEWIFDQTGLLPGSRTGSANFGNDTPITFTQFGIEANLHNGIGGVYADGVNTVVFDYGSFVNGDTLEYATYPAQPAYALSSGPAIVGGDAGSGFVTAFTYRWVDDEGLSQIHRQLLANSMGTTLNAVPLSEPSPLWLMLVGLVAAFGYVRSRGI